MMRSVLPRRRRRPGPGAIRPERQQRAFRFGALARLSTAALLLLLAIAGGNALNTQEVSAQATALVSNTEQTGHANTHLGFFSVAQAFTTGSNTAGYTLTSAEVVVNTFGTTPQGSYSVTINADDSGRPGTVVGTLTNPTALADGNNEFTHTGISLDPSTTYFFVLDSEISTVTFASTTNWADETGEPGWSIANGHFRQGRTSTTWNSQSRAARIRINGEVKGTSTALGQVANLAVTPGTEELALQWDAVTDATGYKVQWKSGTEDWDETSRQATPTGNSHTIQNLEGGLEYTVRVAATSASGDGAWSDEATGTPKGVIWSATMTAAEDDGYFGYSPPGGLNPLGALSTPSANSVGADFTLDDLGLTASTGQLLIDFSRSGSGSESFDLCIPQETDHKRYSVTSTNGYYEEVADSGLTLVDGYNYELQLVTTGADCTGAVPGPPPIVLVSNIQNSTQDDASLTFDRAQAFTTGSNTRGYTLTSVDVSMTLGASNRAATFTADIYTASGGQPGTKLGTLTNPASFVEGVNTFTHAGLDLAASTTYVLVFDSSTSNHNNSVHQTDQTTETGETGWTIADNALRRPLSGVSSWTTISSRMLKIRLNGRVNLGDPPGAPAAPTFGTVTHDSLVVNWVAPTETGSTAITGYDLRYRVTDSGDAWSNGPEDETGLTATIGSLSASTSYDVQVRATNSAGAGAWSASGVTSTTADTRPIVHFRSAEAGTIVEGATGQFGFRMQARGTPWTNPSFKYRVDVTGAFDVTINGGQITSGTEYTFNVGSGVTVTDAGVNRNIDVAVVGDSAYDQHGSVTLTLLPGDGYVLGESQSTSVVLAEGNTATMTATIQDNDGSLPANILSLTATAVSDSSVRVSWTPPALPDMTHPTTSFDIQYRRSRDGGWRDGPQGLPTTSTEATVTELLPGTSYDFQVRQVNIVGPGQWGAIATATTTGDPPPPEIEIWSATMTVGTSATLRGYLHTSVFFNASPTVGALTSSTFTHNRTSYQVVAVAKGDEVATNSRITLNADLVGQYALYVGENRVPFDGSNSVAAASGQRYFLTGFPALPANGQTVNLRLVYLPPPPPIGLLWSTTMTVGVHESGQSGFGTTAPFTYGSLAENTFTDTGQQRTVTTLNIGDADQLFFNVDPAFAAGSGTYRLWVGNKAFDFRPEQANAVGAIPFSNPGLTWSHNQRVPVSLVRLGDQELVVEEPWSANLVAENNFGAIGFEDLGSGLYVGSLSNQFFNVAGNVVLINRLQSTNTNLEFQVNSPQAWPNWPDGYYDLHVGDAFYALLFERTPITNWFLHDRAHNAGRNLFAHGQTYNLRMTRTVPRPPPELRVSSQRVAEGGPGDTKPLDFVVSLSSASASEVTVDYAVDAASTATAGTDYQALTAGTLTFAANERRKTIRVTVTSDDTEETPRDETVVLRFSNPVRAVFAGGGDTLSATGTIRDDDGVNAGPQNTPPRITRFYVYASVNTKLGWSKLQPDEEGRLHVRSGQRMTVYYRYYDRDDPRWDYDEDGTHDYDGEEVLKDGEGEAQYYWARWTGGLAPLTSVNAYGGRHHGNTLTPLERGSYAARSKAGKIDHLWAPLVDAQDCTMQFKATVIDRQDERDDRTITVCVSPVDPTIHMQGEWRQDRNGRITFREDEGRTAWMSSGYLGHPYSGLGSYSGFVVSQGTLEHYETVPIPSWTWTQTSGPTVSLNLHGGGTFATFRAPQVDEDTTLTFTLTGVDDNGRSSSVEFDYLIRDLGSGAVSLGLMWYYDVNGRPGGRVTLSPASDANADSVRSHSWSQLSGPAVKLDDPRSAAPSFQISRDAHPGTAYAFEVTMVDTNSRSASDVVTVTVEGPPEADAGPDRESRPGDKVTLGPGTSDAALTYAWSQLSGPTVALDDASLANPGFTLPPDTAEGSVLEFQLTVTNAGGQSASDTARVTALAPPPAPTACAGPDLSGQAGASITLDGACSVNGFGDAYPLTYAWSQPSGPTAPLDAAASAAPSLTIPSDAAAGATLEFQLTVTDAAGRSASDTVIVTVVLPQPRACAGPDLTGAPGEEVTLEGRCSTNPYGPWHRMTHAWTQLTGDTVQLDGVNRGNPSFTIPNSAAFGAKFEFQLTVTDDEGQTDSDTVLVTVAPSAPSPPTACAGPDLTGEPGEVVALQGNCSTNPHGQWWRMAHRWTQPEGQNIALSDATVAGPTFTVPQDAAADTVYTFTLTVTDKDDESHSDSMTVTVRVPNRAPAFAADTDTTPELDENSPAETNVGSPIAADDPDSDTLTYSLSGDDAGSFDIGSANGQITTKSGVTYDYETKASYSLKVTATDPDGASASIDVTVSLNDVEETPPNRAPSFAADLVTTLLVAENSPAETNVGSPIAADDPDEDTLTYSLSGTDAGSFDIDSANGQITTKSGVTYDYETKSSYSLKVTATDPDGASATIDVTVSLNDVQETLSVTQCSTDLETLAAAVEYAGAWDAADCKAHHQDGRARYFQFTLDADATVKISLSAGTLYVSVGTPQNGWGTVPGPGYEHRREVRRGNGKLLHDGAHTGAGSATLDLVAATTYTVEAAGESGDFTISIGPK